MRSTDGCPRGFRAGSLTFEVYESREDAGVAAATAAAEAMRHLTRDGRELGVIFATGASQLAMLRALTLIEGLPWDRITGFHMDEYLGIGADHPASFRRYLREELTGRVGMKAFYEIDGSTDDPEAVCAEYAARVRAAGPRVCLLGIGENGHLAFNDPFEADFEDAHDARVANLDLECRAQQVAEGWFPSLDAVPARAITLTIPALFRVEKLILSVPGSRKARIVRRVVEEAISAACPATVLKTHGDATVYLDRESAGELGGF